MGRKSTPPQIPRPPSRAKRICRICGARFDAATRDRTCCDACNAAHHALPVAPRECPDCGRVFLALPRQRRCPGCQRRLERERSRDNRRFGARRPLGSTDACEACGKPYVVKGGAQRYCPDCAEEARRANARAKARARMRDKAKAGAQRPPRTTPRACVICGAPFAGKGPRKTCSEACAAELRRRTWRAIYAARKAKKEAGR